MDRYKSTKKVALLGILSNIVLLVLKLSVGVISHSQSMIADGLNSAGDVFSSIMTYIGNWISSRPHDEEHPFGHGKAEYIFSLIISLSLLLVAYQIFRNSLQSWQTQNNFVFSIWLLLVALITIIVKASLFLFCRKIGRTQENLLVLANAEDHRNDVFVTLSTLLSIFLGSWKIYWVDAFVGMGIALWIAYTGIQIFISAYGVLMDSNIDEKVKKDLIEIMKKVPGVCHVDDVRAKPVGLSFILLVKVSVPATMTVYEGHSVAAEIKQQLKDLPQIEDVVVHVNPE